MLDQLTQIVKCKPITVVIGNSLEYGFLSRSILTVVADLPMLSIEVVEDLPVNDPQTLLRAKYFELSGTKERIIYLIARDNYVLPEDLSRLVSVYRQPYPTTYQIQALYLERGIEVSDRTVALSRGITYGELELVLTEAKLAPDFWADVDTARQAKLALIGLESEPPPDIPDVAGLDSLMDTLPSIRAGFSDEARAAGLKYPKGFLIAGVPGTGKTLAARVVALELALPTISLGVDLVCDRGVEPLKLMLAAAEQCSPCILYIDELDKFFAKGSQRQVLGYFLKWLNDRTTPVFCIATLNRLDDVPPELLRAGRWNETYSVTMPDQNQLIAQFKLLLGLRDKRYQDPHFIDPGYWQLLTDAAVNCVGAEVAEIVDRLTLKMVERGALLPLEFDFHELVAVAKGYKRQYARSSKEIKNMADQIENMCEPAGGAIAIITDNFVDIS
jgi:ATPase family associated with various cellular activities (AAA)